MLLTGQTAATELLTSMGSENVTSMRNGEPLVISFISSVSPSLPPAPAAYATFFPYFIVLL